LSNCTEILGNERGALFLKVGSREALLQTHCGEGHLLWGAGLGISTLEKFPVNPHTELLRSPV
jgi:hypothetical protein